MAKLKQTGSVFVNNGLWYYSVQLPWEAERRQIPLKAPASNHTMRADRPRKMAEEAASRWWEEQTRQSAKRDLGGLTVAQLCSAWDAHCKEFYRDSDGQPTSTAINAVVDVRIFRKMYGNASLSELTHADMLGFRDALVKSGASRQTVNVRLWRVKHMIEWALDEALIPAVVKAELTQVKPIKRGRTQASERKPVRPIDDATIAATVAKLMPNTADMVRLHRVTGMRPCELCALRWSLIDTAQTPWVYRVPANVNKNAWRGEFGQPRVVLIGPKGREILARHKDGDIPFSPHVAMREYLAIAHEQRKTPVYGAKKDAPPVPRELSDSWCTASYGRTVRAACKKACIDGWGVNRLRHTFGTEVRRAFGLAVAKAVLGHTEGGCITDVYTYDAMEEETIRTAAPAVEALG